MITAYATCSRTGPIEAINKFRRARLDLVDHLAKANGLRTYRGETEDLAYVQITVSYDPKAKDDPEAHEVSQGFIRLLCDLKHVHAGSLVCETDTEEEQEFVDDRDHLGLLRIRTGALGIGRRPMEV